MSRSAAIAKRLLDILIFVGLVAIILSNSLGGGGVLDISSTITTTVVFALTALMMIGWCIDSPPWDAHARISKHGGRGRRQHLLSAFAIFLVLVSALQFCPLPEPVVNLLSPKTVELTRAALGNTVDGKEISWSTVSVTPWRSAQKWIRLLGYVLFFVILSHSISERRSGRRLAWILLANGTLLALITFGKMVLGTGAGAAGSGSLPARYMAHYGPFMNRNTFAAHMGMLIPLAIGLAASLSYPTTYRHDRASGRVRRFIEFSSHVRPSQVLLVGTALLISATVLCSGSRGAVVALVGALFLSALLLKSLTGSSRSVVFVLGVGILLVFLGVWLRGEQLWSRFAIILAKDDARLWWWRDTAKIIRDFPLLGGGLGSFPTLFSMYKVEPTTWAFVTHPHSDYFNIAAELGIVGLVLCSAIFLILAGRTVGLVAKSSSPSRYLNLGGLIGAAFLLIHSTLTVNLEVPANVFVLLSLLAIAQIPPKGEKGATARGKTNRYASRSPRRILIAGSTLAMILMSALTWHVWREYRARALYCLDRDFSEAEGLTLEERIRLLRRVLDMEPGFAKAHIRLGVLMEQAVQGSAEHSYVQAHDHYVKAICAEPLDPYSHFYLGRLYVNEGKRALGQKVDRSESELLKAHRLAPMDGLFSVILGRYYLWENDTEKAVELFRDSLRLRAVYLPDVFRSLWTKTKSVPLLEQAIPVRADLRLTLAKLLMDKGQSKAALGQLARVMTLKDSLEEPQRSVVTRCLVSLGALEQAEAWLRECLWDVPASPTFERELISVLKKEGKLAEAAVVMAEIAKRSPYNAGHLAATGKLHRQLALYDKAEEYYAAAVRIDPQYYPRLAEIRYLRHGDMSQVVSLYKEWVRKHPEDPASHRYLGLALERAGSISEALVELEKGAKLGAKGQFEADIERLRKKLAGNLRREN